MKKTIVILLTTLTTTLTPTCSTGFDRGALRQRMQEERAVVTDTEVQRVLDLKPQIQFPARLGIYFQDDNYRWGGATWETADKEILKTLSEQLIMLGIASEVFPISSIIVNGNELKDIRLGAARHHADMVLVVRGAYDVNRYSNFASVLYLTIVGLFIVPGTTADALFMLNAALWDVRNEYLYLTVETEGRDSIIGPSVLLEEKDAVTAAKAEALQKFQGQLLQRMKNLAGK